ncbi:bifunctional 2-polyprenyl-6-hydroxyphenol methylase/3-demethylubiquinol 3-O-methyltransferase UbiG [Kitasatospora sp. A2-31]|uniref:class I SAM-dependent methyltransferase n=1 Tax=Kitasatospora sp. A2-31 TaxID=2916414 RepID=UPI001EECEFED|nr:class I SAM-dependent methyltransferase [Kitasatospora sp. A2-31]MCG6497931.1 class I SAM-dependent methyltransferase [Kitasatospora sp. A2-31]
MESRDWDERYAASESVWGAEPNRWVVRELTSLAPGRALDVAAGEGRNSIWLARRGWHVTGLDFSAVALERAERLTADLPDEVADRLTWRHGDARELEVPSEGYDLVLVAYLQLPAEDRRAALVRAAAALAPGGTLLVIAHDSTNLTEGVGGPQDPGVLYTPDDVLADLDGAGLHTVRAERVRRPVDAEGGHRSAAVAGDAGGVVLGAGGDTGAPRRTEAIDALVRLERTA